VEHFTDINAEGRRFVTNCAVEPGSDLELSNRMRLNELPIQISIFETARMQDELAKLPQRMIGSFRFFDAMPPRDDGPAVDAFLSGWFVLNPRSLEDAWNQVREGGYGECKISISIGPVENPSMGRLWDVARRPQLYIDTVQLSFTRPAPIIKEPAPTINEPIEKKSPSFWRWRE
jgi:hypothetical protein